MFHYNNNLVSDASIQSQSRSGILTPASDHSLNLDDNTDHANNGGNKRKRDGSTMEDLLRDTFIVKPYPTPVTIKYRIFQPVLLLPRSLLPLSAIDTVSSAKALSQSRLFESHIKILELENRMGTEPLILIARVNDSHSLFAVERESRGLYVLLQLGSWVNLRQLKTVAIAYRDSSNQPSTSSVENASLPTACEETSKYSKKKRLAIELIQSMVKRPPVNSLSKATPEELNSEIPDQIVATDMSKSPNSTMPPKPVDTVASQTTATEITENVRTQYLEALYVSKASLAYFAKGPLSRARAAFHLDYDSNLDMNEYITFLESLVVSTTLLDKKYRDGIPLCVSLVDINDHSGDEVKPKKRKSNKKFKIGKDGLYPMEDMLIRKWWRSYDGDAETGAPGCSREELTRKRISQLRIRETQLQMIIILEVMALQPLVSAPEEVESGLPSTLPSIEISGTKEKSTKTKDKDRLSTFIDVHIDRLCIWQSIAMESSSKAPDATQSGFSSGEHLKPTDNIPRDFCVEVIAPFFSARLPERCAIINRKLGGPVTVSQAKPKLSKSASFSNAPFRPGAVTKRPIPVKPREQRTLQRVLSDERERRSISQGPNRKIALMRSATMPVGMSLKREESETRSLANIPLADSQAVTANRGGLLSSKRFSQREVDLGSLIPETDAKARQKAVVEAQLKDAISALKRPNRELAGISFAESVEKRSAVNPHPRKSKKPVRNPLFQGIQITATPKAVRHKEIHTEAPTASAAETMGLTESGFVPTSSIPLIPQSINRSSHSALSARNPMISSVQATPSRRSAVSLGVDNSASESFPPSSPMYVRRSSSQLFAFKQNSASRELSAVPGASGTLETPVKKGIENGVGHAHPAVPRFGEEIGAIQKPVFSPLSPGLENITPTEDSIYKSFGWDDDNELDDFA